MTQIRDAYLMAAASAATLLADPNVAARWAEPSALPGLRVGGLAGHLATQVLFLPPVLTEPPPPGTPLTLLEHYARVRWIGADLDDEINVAIRRGGEETAADGPESLTTKVDAAIAELRTSLRNQPEDRVVHPPAGPWPLRLDDFLITRMMEIAVHSDDLAYSVGAETPALPQAVLDPVLTLLTSLSVRRHGAAAVLRALSRAERAPSSIAAF